MDPCLEYGRRFRRCVDPWIAGLAVAVLSVLAGSVRAALPVTIEHQPVACLIAGRYPLIDACFSPSDSVARARVYFRGDGIGEWYYVEMTPEASCFRGVLPRPRTSLRHVSYYVAATDREFAETRTEEFGPVVVKKETECGEGGVVAPVVSSATVVVGALSGAAVPAGFVGGGLLGLGVSTAAAVGVVGAGAVTGAVITGGGGSDTTTTTVPRPSPTPTPTPTPTPMPTPTPTPGPCLPGDSGAPLVAILTPVDNADVGATVDITVVATDPGPLSSGIDEVVFTAAEQGGSRTATIATLPGPGPVFQATWMVPACLGPQDRWYIDARATDRCGRTKTERVRVRRKGDSCTLGASAAPAETTLVWTSELGVPEGRGQVVLDGTQAVFPSAGRSELLVPATPGGHRVEATLVSGGGPGQWRFVLAAGSIRPGSLRVSAGDVTSIGPGAVTFRLGGRAGERVVFTFEPQLGSSGPGRPLDP